MLVILASLQSSSFIAHRKKMSITKEFRFFGILVLLIALGIVINERLVKVRTVHVLNESPVFNNNLRVSSESRRKLLEFLNVDSISETIKKKLPVLETGLSFLTESTIGSSNTASSSAMNKQHQPQQEPKHGQEAVTFLDSSDFTTSISVKSSASKGDTSTLMPPQQQTQSVAISSKHGTSESKDKTDAPLTFLDSLTNHHKEKIASGAKVNIAFAGGETQRNAASNNHKKKHADREDQQMRVNEQEILEAHPYISPRKGTDISPANQMAVLLCPNQSKCIVPELQLQKRLRIYFCKHPTRHGVRFYYLAREGLLLHPNVDLVTEEAIETADYIVYLPGSSPWHLTECNNPSFAKRLVVLDEFDGHTLFVPAATREDYIKLYGGPAVPWYYMYFKRSFVRRHDGIFQGYPHIAQRDVYPLTYSIAEAYVPHTFNHHREIEILCTLRGSKHMTTRLRAQEWVAEYGVARGIKNIISSQVNTASRTTVSMQYFQQMYNSQIIVTVNPANWEGDFRLWESMCTGALIFVDPIFVPHPFPLLDGIHVVYFSNSNKTDLFEKLDYYRSHPIEAKKIAINGYLHAMKYHRTVNMMDYILRTVHMGNVSMNRHHMGPIPKYSFTGQYLNYEAKMQQEMILNCHEPGIYEPLEDKSGHVKRLTKCSK